MSFGEPPRKPPKALIPGPEWQVPCGAGMPFRKKRTGTNCDPTNVMVDAKRRGLGYGETDARARDPCDHGCCVGPCRTCHAGTGAGIPLVRALRCVDHEL